MRFRPSEAPDKSLGAEEGISVSKSFSLNYSPRNPTIPFGCNHAYRKKICTFHKLLVFLILWYDRQLRKLRVRLRNTQWTSSFAKTLEVPISPEARLIELKSITTYEVSVPITFWQNYQHRKLLRWKNVIIWILSQASPSANVKYSMYIKDAVKHVQDEVFAFDLNGNIGGFNETRLKRGILT